MHCERPLLVEFAIVPRALTIPCRGQGSWFFSLRDLFIFDRMVPPSPHLLPRVNSFLCHPLSPFSSRKMALYVEPSKLQPFPCTPRGPDVPVSFFLPRQMVCHGNVRNLPLTFTGSFVPSCECLESRSVGQPFRRRGFFPPPFGL